MDLAKLLALLEDSALYFPAVAEMTDPFEGFLTAATVDMVRQQYAAIPGYAGAPGRVDKLFQDLKEMRKHVFISCWHESSYESAAMWRLYLKSNEGIAISTTTARMKSAFQKSPHQINIGYVQYVDYVREMMPSINPVPVALLKRFSYQHEREVRCLVVDTSQSIAMSIPVDLNELIENVYVAPECPTWLRDLVAKVLKRYGVMAPVAPSALDDRPIY